MALWLAFTFPTGFRQDFMATGSLIISPVVKTLHYWSATPADFFASRAEPARWKFMTAKFRFKG